MKRIGMLGVWGLCLGLTVGCGGRSDETPAEEARDDKDIDISETTTVTETGCLTSSGDRFVLAALETGGPAAETELYQLIGSENELRQHVGREVRVSGMAEPAQVATVRESSAAAPTGTAGAPQGAKPEVTTQAETRLETRRMRVTTVTPTGDECPASGR
jgi:hypothetical protein